MKKINIASLKDASDYGSQLMVSVNAMLMLDSSCQAIIETYVIKTEAASSWYDKVQDGLDGSQKLVLNWRKGGYLYYSQDMLRNIINCANTFFESYDEINTTILKLEKKFDSSLRQDLILKLNSLKSSFQSIPNSIDNYTTSLNNWGLQMEDSYDDLNALITKIQQEETSIEYEVKQINQKIDDLKKQVNEDKKALSKAKSEEKKGIVETIFGVLLIPLTGGASAILAGIGASSISQAEKIIDNLQSQIKKYKNDISDDISQINEDKRQLAGLGTIVMSVQAALTDQQYINESVSTLKTSWAMMLSNLNNIIEDLDKAESSKDIYATQLWFEATDNILKETKAVAENALSEQVTSTHVSV